LHNGDPCGDRTGDRLLVYSLQAIAATIASCKHSISVRVYSQRHRGEPANFTGKAQRHSRYRTPGRTRMTEASCFISRCYLLLRSQAIGSDLSVFASVSLCVKC